MSAGMQWQFFNHTATRVPAAVFAKPLLAARRALGAKHFQEVSVVLVGDARMRRLNANYRGKDRSTDVLSFSAYDGEPVRRLPRPVCGDIIIALPVARRQAKSLGVPLNRELQRLFVHGLLHLAGYDHERFPEAKRMFGLEDAILTATRL